MQNVEQTARAAVESQPMKTRLPEINWVHVAVDMAGGAVKVAKATGVKRQTVYQWIARGKMGHLEAALVKKLSELSGVPIEKLI